MRRRSQARDSFAAVRYAVDTGAMPPPRRRSFLARQKWVVLPAAAATLIGAGFLANETRRQSTATATAAIDCSSARDVWRPACRPENVQSWVAKAASARDESPAATGAIEEQGKRASTPKRIAAGSSKPESKPATTEAGPEPARKAGPAKPAPEPVRIVEAKPEPVRAAPPAAEPVPQVRTVEAMKPEPVRAAEVKPEPQPVRPAPALVAAVTALPGRQPTQQAATPVAPEPPARPALQVEQPSKPEPLPAIAAEPPRAPVKVAAEPAAPSPAEADESARRKRHDRLAARTARREAARAAALAEKREAAAQKAAALAEKREAQRARALAARRDEQQASPRRLARVRPAEPGIRTTAYFPPGFVQALRHYNGRYAYDY
jgi:ribonuclease E